MPQVTGLARELHTNNLILHLGPLFLPSNPMKGPTVCSCQRVNKEGGSITDEDSGERKGERKDAGKEASPS